MNYYEVDIDLKRSYSFWRLEMTYGAETNECN